MTDQPRQRLDAALRRPLLGADDDAGGAVGDPRRVAGGRRAVGVEDGLQRGELLECRVPPDALVGADAVDGDDLLLEATGVLGRGGALVRAQRPGVLVLPRDPELPRDRGGLLHHVEAVEGRGEAVEDHVVEHLAVAELVPEARLRQEVRRSRHGLHPAGHDDVVPPREDHELRDLDRPDRGGADLVDRVGGHLLRDSRCDRRLPRRRLAGARLQHLAHHDVADVLRGDAAALEAGPDRDGAELRRGDVGKPAADPSEGRAHGGHDHGAGHGRRVSAD